MCAKFCCKNFNDVCQVFQILNHYTWGGGVFSSTGCRTQQCINQSCTCETSKGWHLRRS